MRQHLATLKTLNLKAKVTHLKVMKMIYTPDRLKALMAIRHDIDKRRADIDKVMRIIVMVVMIAMVMMIVIVIAMVPMIVMVMRIMMVTRTGW